MCGIVGLFAKNSEMRASLGSYVVPMIVCMGDRGQDSAGLAVFSEQNSKNSRRINLFSKDDTFPWDTLSEKLSQELKCDFNAIDNHAVVISSGDPQPVINWLNEHYAEIFVLSIGQTIDVYKDTGHPREIADKYRFNELKGTHCVGHTRMATESAVTPYHSHPFIAGEDLCLVHNGSLSNHHNLRRMLEKRGIPFETDNDTEAVCRYIQWRLQEGDSIEEALQKTFEDVDGFYTLLIGTADRIVLVRDAFACKPALIAETDDYVAIGSEFRTMAHLPEIENAQLYEPKPEEIYSWKV